VTFRSIAHIGPGGRGSCRAADFEDRGHPIHGVLDIDGQPTIVFGTVCTLGSTRWLAEPAVHDASRSVRQQADARRIGRDVIMPDHIHFFAGWSGRDISFDGWVKYWKSQFSKTVRNPNRRWQSDHWDTRIRTATSYEEKWFYVRNNPVRHGLVGAPSDWPFQGEVHVLRWE